MANRQIWWKCSKCGVTHKNSKDESMGTECPECDKEGFLYIAHDQNIGHKLVQRNGRRQRTERKHKRSGESLNPDHTTGV